MLTFLAGVFTGVTVGILLVVTLVWSVAPDFIDIFLSADDDWTTPVVLEQAHVIANTFGWTKHAALVEPSVGEITDIVAGPRAVHFGVHLLVAGSKGAVALDDAFAVQESVLFHDHLTHVHVIDVEGDGEPEFMHRGQWCCPASLFDQAGNRLWVYGGNHRSPGVDDMAAGDLNGDGVIEFVVGFNGSGGVHLVSHLGARVWRQDDRNVWHVEIVDADGDGSLDILHSNADGTIKIRNPEGAVVDLAGANVYVSDFSIIHWPPGREAPLALSVSDPGLWTVPLDGTAEQRIFAELPDHGKPRGVVLRGTAKDAEYLAVLTDYPNSERAWLLILDHTDTVLYSEILPRSCAAIAAYPGPNGDTLLIGCQDTLWHYRPSQAELASAATP